MKSLLLGLTVLTLVTVAVAVEPVEGFLTDFQAAQAQAKKENKPLYLHFTTMGCTWCRKIENDIYKTPEGQKVLAPFVKVTMDCTVPRGQQPTGPAKAYIQLMQKYGGQGYPFLVMTTPEGDILGRLAGYLPLPKFKIEIDKVLKRWEAIKGLQECKAKGDTSSLKYHQCSLTHYLDKDEWAKAGQAAEALLKLDPKGEKTDAAQIAYAQLCAALAAKSDAVKIAELQNAVIQADPKNEKGYYEKAYSSRIKALMIEGQKKPPAEQQEVLRQMVPLLKEMIEKVPNLSNPVTVYNTLFQVQGSLGDFDGAIQTLEAFKKTMPTGMDTTQIDATIQKLQEMKQDKDKAESSPPPETPAETPVEKTDETKTAPAEK
ncbi:MAG: thioredoxin fold domain-containing protein [Deltaproteobacteria bacterium]|nr:thioredoxin fold domain-containing protein [Deltaproteobacteria bacterium]